MRCFSANPPYIPNVITWARSEPLVQPIGEEEHNEREEDPEEGEVEDPGD
jgi:hypothetical protein